MCSVHSAMNGAGLRQSPSAARFDRDRTFSTQRALFGSVSCDFKRGQGQPREAEVHHAPVHFEAAVDQRSRARRHASMLGDHFHHLARRAPGRDHVFDDQATLARFDLKARRKVIVFSCRSVIARARRARAPLRAPRSRRRAPGRSPGPWGDVRAAFALAANSEPRRSATAGCCNTSAHCR